MGVGSHPTRRANGGRQDRNTEPNAPSGKDLGEATTSTGGKEAAAQGPRAVTGGLGHGSNPVKGVRSQVCSGGVIVPRAGDPGGSRMGHPVHQPPKGNGPRINPTGPNQAREGEKVRVFQGHGRGASCKPFPIPRLQNPGSPRRLCSEGGGGRGSTPEEAHLPTVRLVRAWGGTSRGASPQSPGGR